MEVSIPRYCLSLLLLTSIATKADSNGTTQEESREPRVSGRIVKLYSGVKPEPYLCNGEGFQLDPSNCAAFYRCVKERSGKFTVFRYQCAPGTVYDPDLETCNHPRSTRRSECGGMLKPTSETYHITNVNEIDGVQSEVPHPISTKIPTYTEKAPQLSKNPTTLSWILSTERQNIPTTAPSTLAANQHKTTQFGPTSGYHWSTEHNSEIKLSSKITSPPKTTQQTNWKNNEPCISDGFMGDSENCRKFYRCVGNQRGGYVKYEFYCSELTVWDDEIQGCNHPWAVKRSKCGRSLTYDHKSISQNPGANANESPTITESATNNGGYGYKSDKTIQQQTQISHGSSVTQTQTQISNSEEVIQNQTQINYGNKAKQIKNSESKQNQTQISYGSAVSQTQTQIDYGQKGVQTQLQIDHSKDSSQSQVQIQESTTNELTSPSTQNGDMGNVECSESGFMGDGNDCKKFYRCVDNGRGRYTKFEYFCGDGTVWDPEIEACNHAWAVKRCGGKHSTVPSIEERTTTTTTTKSSEYHTDLSTATQSYFSTNHVPDVEDIDNTGYGIQNNQEMTPSSTTTTTTKKPDGTTTECSSSGFIGDVNNCKIFYRCVDNGNGGFTKYEFKCGDGTLWDSDIEACNHAWAVKNCGGSNIDKEESSTKKENTNLPGTITTTVTLTQITTQATSPIDDYDNRYGSQNQESPTTTTRTTKTPQTEENNKNSECKSSGFMGDENDCKKFYRCVDNGNGGYIRYEFTCGEGTVWDPKTEACNHAWAVEKCGGSTSVTQNTSSTSQSISTTSFSDMSSIYTTPITKETERPVSTTTTTSASSTTTSSSGISNTCSKSGFMGDSSNCKKFYRCVDNGDGSYTRYEFTCGEGTVWDPKIEACNHAWAVEKCGESSESTHATQQTTSQHPVMQDEEQENGYVTPNYETSEILQTSSSTSTISTTSTTLSGTIQCNNSGFMGDQHDCKKFYRCVDNGKGGYDRYEFQCGEGTVWDSSIEACNHAWAIKDCGKSGASTTYFQNETSTQSISSSITSEDGQTQHSTEKTTTLNYLESETTAGDKCIQEGFFGNKMDCKKFYRCVDDGNGGFTKYEFSCGEGTSWNQEIQGCDHASPDKPCNSLSQGTTSREPIYFDDDTDTKTTSTTKATTLFVETDNVNTETTKKPHASESMCQSEGFYGNPSDCKKFYRCVANGNGGYTKYDFNCGDGTVWNQEIQGCDHESADKNCSGTSTSHQNNPTESQSESTTFHSTTKTQESTDKPQSEQAVGSQCTSEGFFAHPNDCKKFIRCVNNGNGGYTRYEFSCGDGTVWVQEIQACDHDNDVTSCSSQSGSTTTYKPQYTEGNPSSTTETSSSSSTESIPPNREDDEYESENSKEPSHSHDETDGCTSEGYFANSQDCRKFYRCVDNGNGGYTKYDFVCGDGTAWDSDLQTCNHINDVKTCSGSSQEGSENSQTTTNKNQGEIESSSSTTKATTSSSDSSTGSTSNGHDRCESEGYFGNSNDCKKFYRCVDNGKGGYTKYDFICGDGTIWDQDITGCNHPQDVSNPSCGTSGIDQGTSGTSTSTITTSSSSQTTSNTTESSSSSQSTSDGSHESSKKPTNSNVTCDKAGYYANPNDCKKFYRCVDWDGDGERFSVFHFECGEGTIWDPALDTCNHEESVYPPRDCSQTQSQNVGGETTTTEGTTTTENNTNGPTTQESTTSEQTTTQESTTSELTTTQQSTTSEQTTTQESTTSELNTTQQSTTSEQTTTEQYTNEPTTTQKSTTSETTTTEQSTSETTTTQQSITSEQTTTEQSTNEPTTTQESTTSEQTTTQESTTMTQESTTSEPSTTQQFTTSEKTTTEQSTTSEQTTTQQSTTSEQTTTQQSPTSEQTTTEQSTTSEQTTTQQSTTTDQATTELSFTSEQTTQESTTSDQTTQQFSTTEQSTTEQSNEQTTNESTTTEQTTESTITTEETTDQSTTQTLSTEFDPTEEQSTTESYSTTETSSPSDKECPETEDDQYVLVCPTSFRRHPKYCNMFYQCTEDDDTYEAKTAMFKCPNNTIYDESQTQCVSEDKADKKCDGEIANKRRFKRLGLNYKDPILADKGKQSCSAVGYFSFEKHSECAKGFLKCERSKNGQLRGFVYQCPEGYIYWSISKRCERKETVRDCKQSSNDWTGRWNIPVERKNVARN